VGFLAQILSKTCPSTTKLALGLIDGDKLAGVGIWGYGVRPRHTIQKLFPSLEVINHLEINRLCVLDEFLFFDSEMFRNPFYIWKFHIHLQINATKPTILAWINLE
jgi:hypothetical protein